ncbi:MAG: thymidylate synthase [Clostridia bacterium]|nr:thymidylate synthase [Clostridia bacterium]
MSFADHIFIDMCRDILDNGTDTKGEKVRPHWEDGETAYTIKKFGVVNRYDLSKEFPAITLRKTALKSCVDEILWIWQKKSNKVSDLYNPKIWEAWAKEDGTIGKAYGYQLAQKYQFKQGVMDQVDNVLWQLKNTPFSRRIMTSLYNFSDLSEMGLEPCAYSVTFNVTQGKEGKLVLNTILNQRSSDVLTANNWNVVQYAVLTHMFAQVCDMQVGEMIHMIADAHIYDRHVPLVEELIQREPLPAPKLWLNPEIKDFYDFTLDDVKLLDYETHEQIKGIPVAI